MLVLAGQGEPGLTKQAFESSHRVGLVNAGLDPRLRRCSQTLFVGEAKTGESPAERNAFQSKICVSLAVCAEISLVWKDSRLI